MALEIAAMASAVSAIGTLVKETVPIIQNIRSSWLVKNDDAKTKLEQNLTTLQENLQKASDLAQAAEVYCQVHESIHELLGHCRHAERFLKDNLEDCRNAGNADYVNNWRYMETIVEQINSSRDVPRKVAMGREEWYDQDDKARLETYLNQFTSSFDKAKAFLKSRVADDLVTQLTYMVDHLENAKELLSDTIYKKILGTLRKLRP
jgi:RNA polymerase subunit RPABC4/transcription elongation factor Spt4